MPKGIRLFSIKARLAVPLLGLCAALLCGPANADVKRTTFAVMRNGDQIGTHTIAIETNGAQTVVDSVTHIQVTLAFVTLYRFDQTEVEHWDNRQLLSLETKTDDNGKTHTTSASRTADVLAIKTADRNAQAASKIIPLDLWNPAVMSQTSVLDPQSGTIVPVKVVDKGEDAVTCGGNVSRRAHHYLITTTFSQDVWYDDAGQLVAVQMTARDGSVIRYQPA